MVCLMLILEFFCSIKCSKALRLEEICLSLLRYLKMTIITEKYSAQLLWRNLRIIYRYFIFRKGGEEYESGN